MSKYDKERESLGVPTLGPSGANTDKTSKYAKEREAILSGEAPTSPQTNVPPAIPLKRNSVSVQDKFMPSQVNIYDERLSTLAPSRQIDRQDISKSLVSGSALSLPGFMSPPIPLKQSGNYENIMQGIRDENYQPQTGLGQAAKVIGREAGNLPLWLTGEAAIAKGATKLIPQLGKVGQKLQALPKAIRGGGLDAATYGGVVAPAETLMEGGGLRDLAEKEKFAPLVGAGGALLRGVGGALTKPTIKPPDIPQSNPLSKLSQKDLAKTEFSLNDKLPIAETKPLNKLQPLNQAEAANILKDDTVYKEIVSELEGARLSPDEEVISIAPNIKDKSGLSLNIKDVYRNFRDMFGKSYNSVKAKYLDPFDKSKGEYANTVKRYTDDVYNKVVKDLGIKKGSKESAGVQWYGEGKKMTEVPDPQTGNKVMQEVEYTLDNLKKDFPTSWKRIVSADNEFRRVYDELIDAVNATRAQIYPTNPDKLVPKRTDYYRHFKEMSDGFEGLRNMFDTPSQIDPKLAGISEFTKPKSKFAGFMQKRGEGEYTADAVGGFVEYIRPAAYSIHIDPHISKFRGLAKDIAEATAKTKNANNTIKWLNDFSNSLAGKTNKYDRLLQEDIPGGRTAFRALNWLNSRVKKNTVLLNARSAISQLANVPAGISRVKDPVSISKGVGQTLSGIIGKPNPAMKQSQFINERYLDEVIQKFNTKLLDKPQNFASWLIGGADKLGTGFIWNSAYSKALSQGIVNPVKYADDLTRSVVAGRGIGEVPLMQQAKTFQLIAPFQLEVANLWNIIGDMKREKDIAGVILLLLGNFAFNEAVEKGTGTRTVFDPIDAMIDAIKEGDMNPVKVAGRLGGEVLSNVPLGQTAAALYPEYGADISTPLGKTTIPTRKELFGENDPTRFGGGLLVTKALTDPLYKVLPPLGGGQIKKTVEGLSAFNKGGVEKNDKLYFPIEKTSGNFAKSALFGKYSTPEATEYFDKNRRPLSENQTQKVDMSPDRFMAYEQLMKQRELESLKRKANEIKKDKKLNAEEKRKAIKELQNEWNKLKSGG